jgi:hypothetical protein
MSIRENVGEDLYGFSGRAFDGESPGVDRGPNVLDDNAASQASR